MILTDNLKKYLNQKATFEAKSGVDRYGNQAYAEPVAIAVRREGNIKLVRNVNGEQITSMTTIFTATQVNPLDKLDGHEVINVSEMVNREGKVIGWECYI